MNRSMLLILSSLLTLLACDNVQRPQSKSEEIVKLLTIDSMCISYIENHPDGFNNEITSEKAAKEM